jgi:hypothetical protein
VTLHAISPEAMTTYGDRLCALFAEGGAFREIWRADGMALTEMRDGKPVFQGSLRLHRRHAVCELDPKANSDFKADVRSLSFSVDLTRDGTTVPGANVDRQDFSLQNATALPINDAPAFWRP